MTRQNNQSHDYSRFAKDYSRLGIKNTDYLAFRDIPNLIEKYCTGHVALDYGCGAGRCTQFLKGLGFDAIGVDTSPDMISEATKHDPDGRYELLQGTSLPFDDSYFDLVFQKSVIEEIPSRTALTAIFSEIYRVMKDTGIGIIVTASAIRTGEWSTFIYPDSNENISSGSQVKLLFRDTDIVLYDYVWLPSDVAEIFKNVGLKIAEKAQPLATGEEPFRWYQELSKPFWDVYVLTKLDSY